MEDDHDDGINFIIRHSTDILNTNYSYNLISWAF